MCVYIYIYTYIYMFIRIHIYIYIYISIDVVLLGGAWRPASAGEVEVFFSDRLLGASAGLSSLGTQRATKRVPEAKDKCREGPATM